MEEKKLKIGFFTDSFYPMVDGVVSVVDNLAKRLLSNFDVTVFTIGGCKGKKDEKEHPYKVVRCKTKPIFFLDYDIPCPKFDKEFLKQVEESNLDIVYCHSPMMIAKVGIDYAKRHNIPVISHLHSQFKRDFYRATHSKLLTKALLAKIIKVFNKSDCAIAVNEYTKDLFVNDYKLKAKTVVINNATDMTPVEDFEKAKENVNNQFGLTKNNKVLTFVGRINKLKNIDLILDSLPLLDNKDKNIKFLVVGSGGDLEYFKAKTKKLGLEDVVIFAGRIMDKDLLKSVYVRADLFVFPSFYDTDGIVKFEAGAQKTPTVFVEGTGACSQIVDGETGFVAQNSAQSFAQKIMEALNNEELYNKVAKNSYEKVYRTWDKSAMEVKQLILEQIELKKEQNNKNTQ